LYDPNLLTLGFGFDAIGDCIQLPPLRDANFAASFDNDIVRYDMSGDSGSGKERAADAEGSTTLSDESNGAANSRPKMDIKSERSMSNVHN
jgi:hypothetical protein